LTFSRWGFDFQLPYLLHGLLQGQRDAERPKRRYPPSITFSARWTQRRGFISLVVGETSKGKARAMTVETHPPRDLTRTPRGANARIVTRRCEPSRTALGASASVVYRPLGVAFGPQKSVSLHSATGRNFFEKPCFSSDSLTSPLQSADGRMLRNTSHLGHISALNVTFDQGYNAVSIWSRVIDKAFVYCKNLRCRG
jgi:hypothetical protein